MFIVSIKSNLNELVDVDKKILSTLNIAIHQAGFMLEAAIKQDIASFPSVDTGRYLNSVTTDIGIPFVARVFTEVPYAIFLEYGTSPHFVKPATKQALAWNGGGEFFFSKGHMVRGIAPRSHFSRTADFMAPEIGDFVNGELASV